MAEEHDLQQFFRIGLEVQELAQELIISRPKRLRLINDKNRCFPVLVLLDQVLLKLIEGCIPKICQLDLSGLGKLIEFLQVVKLGKRLYPLAG